MCTGSEDLKYYMNLLEMIKKRSRIGRKREKREEESNWIANHPIPSITAAPAPTTAYYYYYYYYHHATTATTSIATTAVTTNYITTASNC